MARTNMNLPDDIDQEMRHEAVDLGLRYPGEFVKFLWKKYKKYKEEKTMTLKSYTAEEIRAKLAADTAKKAFELDTGNAGHDDILLGESLNDVRIDVAVYHGWDDDPENWTRTERGWEAPSIDGGDDVWLMNPDTGLPVGWSLREISRDELE